jgi:aldehyde dehydrogenase (NAD+)
MSNMTLVTPTTDSRPAAGRKEEPIADTVARLRRAFDSGITRSLEWREAQLRQLLRMFDDNDDAMEEALRLDLGKCRFESFVGETGFTKAELKHTLKNLRRWVKPQKVKVPLPVQPSRARIQAEPLGVVLIIAPWNYPIQLALGPLIPALAAGNTAIVKPSEVAPATSALIARLVPKYLDRDAVAVVEGGIPETTALLAQKFDHIFYTGNGAVAKIVMRAAAEHLTPVTLELGGKSPCIVDQNVDLDVAARRIVWSKFFNAGQTCVAPDYVLVHERIEQRLIDKLRDTIHDFYGDDPRQSRDYPRIINDRHHARLSKLLASGKLVAGGEVDATERYIAPTLMSNVSPDAPVMQEEIFGPILPILSVASLEAAVEFVNRRDKPLALYVFTSDKQQAERVLEQTSSGGACVNDCVSHLLPPELPFGGVGASGMGAYHGKAGFDTFSHRKSVLDRPTRIDPPLLYPPYASQKLKWIKRLM